MPKAKKTETKKHNWVTGPNNKVVKVDEDRATMLAICSCNHLTPASEAALDNLLGWKVSVPKREETIKRNEPGFVEPELPEMEVAQEDGTVFWADSMQAAARANWMDTEPTKADLAAIEAAE